MRSAWMRLSTSAAWNSVQNGAMPCASRVSSGERVIEHTTTSWPDWCRCFTMLNGRIVPPRLGGYGKRWQTYRILMLPPWPCGPSPRAGTSAFGAAVRRSRDRLLQLIGHVVRCAPVEYHAAPDLEVEQRQQLVGAVDPIGAMVLDQPRHRFGIQQAACLEASARQRAAEQLRQRTLEPCTHWCAEAALRSVQHLARQHIGERLLHQ